eukprot:scaffold8610_cov73-Cylindrotheca_fusiformis.AAC.2
MNPPNVSRCGRAGRDWCNLIGYLEPSTMRRKNSAKRSRDVNCQKAISPRSSKRIDKISASMYDI